MIKTSKIEQNGMKSESIRSAKSNFFCFSDSSGIKTAVHWYFYQGLSRIKSRDANRKIGKSLAARTCQLYEIPSYRKLQPGSFVTLAPFIRFLTFRTSSHRPISAQMLESET